MLVPRTVAAALASFVVLAPAVQARTLAPCDQLAAHARRLPASAWSDGYKALAADLRLASPVDWPVAKRIAASPRVLKALGDADASWDVKVTPLAGGALYLASMTAGTLDCQQLQFVQVAPGGALVLADAPPTYGDLCWTSWAEIGRPLGAPALVEIESYDSAGPTQQKLEITPWTSKGWGEACRLTLTYQPAFTLTERFCGDAAVCAAVAPMAADIARRYSRQGNPARFRIQPPPDKAGAAAFAPFAGGPDGAPATPKFPTFGAKPATQLAEYSYSNVTLFPLTLSGATYVAAIGYGGVGWRDIGDMLLAIYAPQGDQLKPLAGFVVVRSVVGLESVDIGWPKPVPPQG